MKKNYILCLLVVFTSFHLSATTYTSAQNGTWMNPLSWSPTGIPLPGDIVSINHSITLDTSLTYTTGSITVNASGSLIQNLPVRSIWLNGVNAAFTNNGTTTVKNLLLSAGSFSNSGNFNVNVIANNITIGNTGNFNGVDSLLNNGTLNNNGTIKVMTFLNMNKMNNYKVIQGLTTIVDSMYNTGTFLNDVGALLKVNRGTNSGTFTNNGVVNFNLYTNAGVCNNNNYLSFLAVTNMDKFINSDSLIGLGSMTNMGNFENQNGAFIRLGVSLLNADPANFDAVFNNDGTFDIGDSFFNFDTITGSATGSFVVQDSSVNYTNAQMRGSFDFCDMTPPANFPFVDINIGTIDANITYCLGLGLESNTSTLKIELYPNPTNKYLNILSNESLIKEIYNGLGEQIISTKNKVIDLSNYPNGIYFVQLKNGNGKLISQEKVVKY